MRRAAAGGFINATDCADYLVGKGLPFRDAYKATGELVARCIDRGLTLETLPLEEYRQVCPPVSYTHLDVYKRQRFQFLHCLRFPDVPGGYRG